MNVFISYARKDRPSAQRLHRDLLGMPDVEPWLDYDKLLPGQDWNREIMKAMHQCDLVILLLSSHSVSKEGYVQKEIREALERLAFIPPGRIFIIPAHLEECQPALPELEKLQWVDLFPDWAEGLERIRKVIERERRPTVRVKAFDLYEFGSREVETSRSWVERQLAVGGPLRGADLMNLDLSRMDFSRRDLAGANLVGCRLEGCRFAEANLRGANLERAQLQRADLARADLWGVNFWRAAFAGATHLDEAVIEHTNFWGAEGLSPQMHAKLRPRSVVQLGDYRVFVDYFLLEVGLTREQLLATFLWLKHPYFASLFEFSNRRE